MAAFHSIVQEVWHPQRNKFQCASFSTVVDFHPVKIKMIYNVQHYYSMNKKTELYTTKLQNYTVYLVF